MPGPDNEDVATDPQSSRQRRVPQEVAPGNENAATQRPEDLSGRSRATERPGHALCGVSQWDPERQASGLAVGGPGRGTANHLRQQAGREGMQRTISSWQVRKPRTPSGKSPFRWSR